MLDMHVTVKTISDKHNCDTMPNDTTEELKVTASDIFLQLKTDDKICKTLQT